MKKLFILLFVLASLLPQAANAQNRREIVFTLGVPAERYLSDYTNDIYSWDLYSGYEPRFVKDYFTPALGVQYQQFVTNRINIGVMGAWAATGDRLYEPVDRAFSDNRDQHNFYLLAQARYYYKNQGDWQFYSGLGVGGKLSATFLNDKRQSLKPGLAYEAVLLGIRQDVIIPIFAELIYGNTSFGARFGIGFTF
ncbi:MAG: hypothetical protein J5693_01965 [Bacteroidales bacterium]|nr:hypothetical protein [Bacteroidales bacterium]